MYKISRKLTEVTLMAKVGWEEDLNCPVDYVH